MARIFKNKTDEKVGIQCDNLTQFVIAGGQYDLSESFTPAQLQACDGLIELLGQGTDKYQLNDGSQDLTVARAIDLIRGYMPDTALKTPDKKTYVRASSYTLGTRLYITGRGDDRNDGVGKGERFEHQQSTAGDSDWLSWGFNDWIEMGGGGLEFMNAELGDWVTMDLMAPASVVTVNSAGEGNCNIHPTYGILIPAAGDGAYDIDLSEGSSAPVPLLTTGGLWNWSYPDTGLGQVIAAPSADGNCNLVPQDYPIHTYVQEVGILGNGTLNFTYPGIDPTRILPQWRFNCRVHNEVGGHDLEVAWKIVCARMSGRVSTT